MVTSARAPLRVDRLRALNIPQQVTAELDGRGMPQTVVLQPGDGKTAKEDPGFRRWRVESIGELWRVDDEWWRQPISRRYVDVVLEGGKHVVLFEDLATGQWWLQQP
jgi:hypothetical protein